MSSKDLVASLVALEEAEWAELNTRQLARLLKPYGIRPNNLRIAKEGHPDTILKGYKRDDFKDAFSRYIPAIDNSRPTADLSATPATQSQLDLEQLSATEPLKILNVADNLQSQTEANVALVAGKKGGEADNSVVRPAQGDGAGNTPPVMPPEKSLVFEL